MENNFYGMPPFSYEAGFDPNINDNPMFNPIMQYEQAYMYYKYLTQQMEYKIKCKEYDKLNSSNTRNDTNNRRE